MPPVKRIKSYILENRHRLLKFLTVGATAAAINLGLMYILVQHLGFSSMFLENVANALSMEVSILYNFVLSRHWTWSDAIREEGMALLKQLASFHAVIATTAVLRLVLFPMLQLTGIHYLLNTAIGIGCAAAINYFLYDNLIFKSQTQHGYEE